MNTTKTRKAVNITIRKDLKKRYTAFVAWLNRYHEADDIWTQNTAMDEILSDSDRWQRFRWEECIKERAMKASTEETI